MASVSAFNSPNIYSFHWKPISKNLIIRPFFVSFPFCKARLCSIKANSDGVGPISNGGADLLRKPVASSPSDGEDDDESEKKGGDGDTWVDWEDQILQDTVPLVGFVRMILHSGKYESGDRLSPEHEKNILERLLAYHPESEKKIGCGVDYITIGYHPNFESSRCLFIVRKDGELVDFSFWKCIKGLIRKNYPLYADSFILRHFRRRRRSD
ncbi:protein dcl chloroplastic [Phtheirospermum japonicum]|uniref:Protein dcl chloroplastic n=1 Tax=Phtheirospermum japonicum TaxID=374723 RepID=A0A830DA37_9LAMI|nr:protein dcl chloroplastic [Phtheirospermum japonicum]